MKFDDTFSQLLNACADLTSYSIAVRYPNELAVDDTVTKLAINKAETIFNFCIKKVKEAENN